MGPSSGSGKCRETLEWIKFLVRTWVPNEYMVSINVAPDFFMTHVLRQYHAYIASARTFQKNLAGIKSLKEGEGL